MLTKRCEECDIGRAKRVYASLDTDGNGVLEKEELAVMSLGPETFADLDWAGCKQSRKFCERK